MVISSDKYIQLALKYSRFLALPKITVDEYAYNLLESCVLLEEFDNATVQAVAASVPGVARERVIEEIGTLLAPDSRFRDLSYGGPGPSPELREQQRTLYEKRIQAFAVALLEAMRTPPPSSATDATKIDILLSKPLSVSGFRPLTRDEAH